MLSPNYPVLCFPLPYRVAPVFVQVVSPSLGWSPLSSFLVIWSPTGDTRGPSVVFEAVDMPCPGPFHFSYSVDYIYDFCPLPDPDVGLSVFVCDVEHTSFHFFRHHTQPQPRNYRHNQIPRYPYQQHSKLEHSHQQDCTESKHDFSLPPQKHSHMPTQNQTPSLHNTGTSHPRICQHHMGPTNSHQHPQT